jgi:uncharacterized protein YndB with AHSA1/START domain
VSSIELEQFIARAPAAVWRALTEPDLMGRWWVEGDIKPVVGHRFTLDMGPWGVQECEVLEVEPEKLLRYTFAEESLGSTLTFRLQPEGDGTRLFFEHAGLDENTPSGLTALRNMGNGWPRVLAHLADIARTIEDAGPR